MIKHHRIAYQSIHRRIYRDRKDHRDPVHRVHPLTCKGHRITISNHSRSPISTTATRIRCRKFNTSKAITMAHKVNESADIRISKKDPCKLFTFGNFDLIFIGVCRQWWWIWSNESSAWLFAKLCASILAIWIQYKWVLTILAAKLSTTLRIRPQSRVFTRLQVSAVFSNNNKVK